MLTGGFGLVAAGTISMTLATTTGAAVGFSGAFMFSIATTGAIADGTIPPLIVFPKGLENQISFGKGKNGKENMRDSELSDEAQYPTSELQKWRKDRSKTPQEKARAKTELKRRQRQDERRFGTYNRNK